MIAIDTNVLVRLLVADDPAQHAAAKRFFAEDVSASAPGFLSLLVLVETHWVLSRAYRFDAASVQAALLAVLESEQVAVERADLVRQALADPAMDFADALIHLIGIDAGCSTTVTFDQRFARKAGVTLLA